MSALLKFRTAGFQISLKGEGFRIEPANKLLPEQVEFLKSHKAEIIEGLNEEQALFFMDDRKHCHDCRNLINELCIASKTRYKPLDDIPRRCKDFA